MATFKTTTGGGFDKKLNPKFSSSLLTSKNKFSMLCCAVLLNASPLSAVINCGSLACIGISSSYNGSDYYEIQNNTLAFNINSNNININSTAMQAIHIGSGVSSENAYITINGDNVVIQGADYGIYNEGRIADINLAGASRITGSKAGIYNSGYIHGIINTGNPNNLPLTIQTANGSDIYLIDNRRTLIINNGNGNVNFDKINNKYSNQSSDNNYPSSITINNDGTTMNIAQVIENDGSRGGITISNKNNSSLKILNEIANDAKGDKAGLWNNGTSEFTITNDATSSAEINRIRNETGGSIHLNGGNFTLKNVVNSGSTIYISEAEFKDGAVITNQNGAVLRVDELKNRNNANIRITNDGGSRANIDKLTNTGTGNMNLSGAYTIGTITNTNGSINVDEALLDTSNFDTTSFRRLALRGDATTATTQGGINDININRLTLRNANGDLENAKNISQFIDGALIDTNGDVDTTAYDEYLAQNAAFNGYTLVGGLKDKVGDENFINLYGITGVGMSMQNSVGDFRTFATPGNSAGAELNKDLVVSMQRRVNFIDGAINASINDLMATDLQSLGKKNTIIVMPYFSSLSINLDNEDTSKGHVQGLAAGYSSEVEDSESFYSLYMGYEDMKVRSSNYSVGSRGLYAGFRYLDYITQLGENTSFFIQYNGTLSESENHLTNRESSESANPNSYYWVGGANLVVHCMQGDNIYTTKWGLSYMGGIIEPYTMDEGTSHFDRNNVNLFISRAGVSWTRVWSPHFLTTLQGGLKYYFNPDVDYSYFSEILDAKVKDTTTLDRWNEFIGASFIVPLNSSFYFKISYNGIFSKDGDVHTGLARFTYLF